jgi:hypothetical protein
MLLRQVQDEIDTYAALRKPFQQGKKSSFVNTYRSRAGSAPSFVVAIKSSIVGKWGKNERGAEEVLGFVPILIVRGARDSCAHSSIYMAGACFWILEAMVLQQVAELGMRYGCSVVW